MRGLIYKDTAIFFKSIDKKSVIIAVGAIMLLMYHEAIYAGLFASILFAMAVGIQNVMGFSADEQANWKKYQLAMPVKGFSVVAGKYASVICTLAVSLLGSALCNLLSSILFHNYDFSIWAASAAIAVVIPLVWTGICLPLTYWFGFRFAQTMGVIVVIPIWYCVKYFEDGAGFSSMVGSIHSYIAIACVSAWLLFGISIVVSVIGYERKR